MNQPLAFVHPEAKIAEDVKIDPFVTIHKNVQVGEGTWIGSSVTIMEGARIGKNCRIFPGAVISAIPQDLKFVGEETTVEIGDNTTIRECVTVNRGTKAKLKTIVGNNCLIMAYSHIAHDCIIGDSVILGNGTQLAGEVDIDEHAILSGHVLVHQFVHIGSHVIISGGSLVRKDVPPFVTAAREPLAFVGINSVGLRRRNFDNKIIGNIHDAYRILYMKGYNYTNALDIISKDLPKSPELDTLISFVRNSKRGIIRGYKSESGAEDIQ
jgi:UDP-N-acetylglucosamine acyltransferase